MNKINIDKDKLVKFAAIIVGVGGFLFLYLYYFWIPSSKKIDEMKKKVSNMELEIKKAEEISSRYPDLNKKLLELQTQKADIEKKLPKEKNMQDLMKTIKKIADKHSIVINSISPSTTVKDQYFFRITYNISITGSYHNVASFFAEISLQERILNVENVVIPGGELSSVNFILVSYQYIEGK